uniref:C-type lectin domain-containing protein n=1 Tax=Scleropages formosus TaxID=113540 RepID=A0A8C9SIJ1_SCLFO
MSAEVIYSDVKFTCSAENQEPRSTVSCSHKQDDSGEWDCFFCSRWVWCPPMPHASLSAAGPRGEDRAAHPEAQVKKPGCGPVVWVPMCLCALLVGVAVGLGVLYSKQQKEKDLEKHQHVNKSSATDVQDCKACPSGWNFHAGKCYYFSSDKMAWNASARSCITMGGHLVMIDSEEEQKFLLGEMSTKMTGDDDKFWIGLSDAEEEGRWLWMDKTPLNKSVTFWLTTERYKEPDNWTEENENGEDCARMGERSTVNIRIWYDASCEKPLKRVCEALAATPSRGL